MNLHWNNIKNLLETETPFCFIKINDGESRAILRENVDISRGAQNFNGEMGYKLFKALSFQANNYYVGIPCSKCYPVLYKKIKDLRGVDDNYPANLLINTNFDKSLILFRNVLPKRRVILVCGEGANIRGLDEMFSEGTKRSGVSTGGVPENSTPFNLHAILRTPEKNSWDVYRKYKEGWRLFSDNDVILFCCGPVGRCLAQKWYKNNPKLTCLELGSFFDPWFYKRAYMYHTNTLPYCGECNSGGYNGISEDCIKKCDYLEKYHWSEPDLGLMKRLYGENNFDTIKKVYSILLLESTSYMKYYIKFMLALCEVELYDQKGGSKEIFQSSLESKINEFLVEYPNRIEAVYHLSKKLTDKKRIMYYGWKMVDIIKEIDLVNRVNKLNEPFREKELYEWKVYHDLVFDCYYEGCYEDSYKAWELNMEHKRFPDHMKEICIDNGRYAKMVLDDKNTLEKFKNELDLLENLPTEQNSLSDHGAAFVTKGRDHSTSSFVDQKDKNAFAESSLSNNSTLSDIKTSEEIPKLFHFIYIAGGHDFLMAHYIALKSCKEVHSPDEIRMYHNVKDEDKMSEFWHLSKKFVRFIFITVPTYVNGNNIPYPQHKADLMRVNILYKFGGVYMDIDALSVSPFVLRSDSGVFWSGKKSKHDSLNLYTHSLVMCKEDGEKLCNCVILSRKNHVMIGEWCKIYETKYGNKDIDFWGGLSVMTPYNMMLENKDWDITVLNTHIFLPFSYKDATFFHKDISEEIKESVVVHLWDTEMMKYGLIPKDREYFSQNNNTFTTLFSKYITL